MMKPSKEKILIGIGLFFLILTLYFVRTYIRTYIHVHITKEKEGFTSVDSDLTLQSCPPGTQSYQSKNGDTDCCDGEYLDFKCSGKTICTMSPSHDGLLPCIDALRKRLRDKASKQCPKSMQNYFENPKSGLKGCTSGSRLSDGTGPKDMTQKKCIVYDTEMKNINSKDSCLNQQKLEAVVCPVFPGKRTTKALEQWQTSTPVYFVCSMQTTNFTSETCIEDESLKGIWNKVWPNWRTDMEKDPTVIKPRFCSVYKQLRIDKSIKNEQLANLKIQ